MNTNSTQMMHKPSDSFGTAMASLFGDVYAYQAIQHTAAQHDLEAGDSLDQRAQSPRVERTRSYGTVPKMELPRYEYQSLDDLLPRRPRHGRPWRGMLEALRLAGRQTNTCGWSAQPYRGGCHVSESKCHIKGPI
jgi:hypothetical protein